MHELGLCQDIIGAVERRAAGRRVSGCTVRVGALHQVVEPALEQSFALAAEGTVAEGAVVNVVVVPVQVRCRSCRVTAVSDGFQFACGGCGSTDLELRGGDELVLESIELEAATRDEGRIDVPRHTG